MQDNTKTWTSVAGDSESSDRQIHQSCQSLRKPAAQMLPTCLTRLRSDVMVTLRTQPCSLAVMVSSPRCVLGPQPPSSDRLCFVPVQSNSVFSAFSFSRFADIQWLILVMQCLSHAAVEAVSQWSQCICNCKSLACAWKLTSWLSLLSVRSAVYRINNRGPSTDLCGTEQKWQLYAMYYCRTRLGQFCPTDKTGTILERYHTNQTDAQVGLAARYGPQCQKQLSEIE